MSKYTTELRFIIESGYDLNMLDYPIFNETYRAALNEKIFNHYLFHEIGFETVEKFNIMLQIKMNEIMPYYNKMLESELLEINPLLTFERNVINDTDKTSNETNDNNATINTDSTNIGDSSEDLSNTSNQATDLSNTRANNYTKTGTSKNVDSDTPTNLLLIGDISSNVYASKVGVNENEDINTETETLVTDENIIKTDTSAKTADTSTTNASDTISSTEGNRDLVESINNVITENGFELPLSELLQRYRKTFLNIDMMIIKELQDLFMMIY